MRAALGLQTLKLGIVRGGRDSPAIEIDDGEVEGGVVEAHAGREQELLGEVELFLEKARVDAPVVVRQACLP